MKFWPFKRLEKRHTFTELARQWRYEQLTGQVGIADLTGTVQSCLSLWESGLSLADVEGPDVLTPEVLAMTARSLGLSGEALWFIGDHLIPVSDYDVQTQDGRPTAYRLTLPDILGGRTFTALATEVLHFKTGVTMREPWRGTAPLQRASLSAGLLDTVERALAEVYGNAPIGSQVMPRPEDPSGKDDGLAASFRGKRGRVLLPESVNVTAAGGAAPNSDWRPNDLTPDLSRSELTQTYQNARNSIMGVYGVLPALMDKQTTGPLVREAQRHLAQWTLTPLAHAMAHEASDKLGAPIKIDVSGPLRAFDAGGRARALSGVISALQAANEAGIDPQAAAAFAGVEV